MSDTDQDQVVCPEMGYFCFDVLYSHLNSLERPLAPEFTNRPYPLFVSWNSGLNGVKKKLRGCTGTFDEMKLHDGLREFAINSAQKDSRFYPIRKTEILDLSVSISILKNFEEGRNFLDWQLGVHGIKIDFHQGHKKYSATFLPEVPPEQGWSQTQTIDHLLKKGGFRGSINEKVRSEIKLIRYQSEKVTVTYEEWEKYKNDLLAAAEASGAIEVRRLDDQVLEGQVLEGQGPGSSRQDTQDDTQDNDKDKKDKDKDKDAKTNGKKKPPKDKK